MTKGTCKMSYKRILTAQDISCLGQCSLTVALPILSACGLETCILPSVVLSTHTVGFGDYTFRDLTEDMPKIQAHWQSAGIAFDAIYTGYLGTVKQIEHIKQIFATMGKPDCTRFVDPVMADSGVLYPGFDENYVDAMRDLCSKADVILPNITEGSLLTGMDYREQFDKAYVEEMVTKLSALGPKTVILTGVGYSPDKTGVAVYENGLLSHYEHDKLKVTCHGTGDVFSSTFVGCVLKGLDKLTSAKIAADFVYRCIVNTYEDKSHWYGVKFEPMLKDLILSLEEAE